MKAASPATAEAGAGTEMQSASATRGLGETAVGAASQAAPYIPFFFEGGEGGAPASLRAPVRPDSPAASARRWMHEPLRHVRDWSGSPFVSTSLDVDSRVRIQSRKGGHTQAHGRPV